MESLVALVAVLVPIIIVLIVFVWLYFDAKGKRQTILEISKNLDDSSKVEELLKIFDDRKKEPVDYRRNGVITLFVGLGLFLLGFFLVGDVLKGVGLLIAAIGFGILVAGYLYPSTSEEIDNVVDKFEKK